MTCFKLLQNYTVFHVVPCPLGAHPHSGTLCRLKPARLLSCQLPISSTGPGYVLRVMDQAAKVPNIHAPALVTLPGPTNRPVRYESSETRYVSKLEGTTLAPGWHPFAAVVGRGDPRALAPRATGTVSSATRKASDRRRPGWNCQLQQKSVCGDAPLPRIAPRSLQNAVG